MGVGGAVSPGDLDALTPDPPARTDRFCTLDVCMDPVAARLIDIEGPVGLGWSRGRDSEEHYTRRNIRLLLQALIDAGIYRDDIPVHAMAQLVTGKITHTGIALAEAPARKRKQIRNELQTAIHQLMAGLRVPTK